ncbi:MAG: error-prone DNA polymerase, partial [Deltaproteobacteria bacterium]|nr:error-prone DNA polymerase [Deltaproteobacteria bacterium]
VSNFSFLRGASHPEELVGAAHALGYHAIGIGDLNSLAGVVRAHIAAKKLGMRYFVGTQLLFLRELPEKLPTEVFCLPPESLPDLCHSLFLPFTVFAYPRTREAYGRLCRLLTLGKRRGPKGAALLTLEDLFPYAQDFVCIAVVHDYLDSRLKVEIARLAHGLAPGALSLAIWSSYGPDQNALQEEIEALASEFSIPLVATNYPLFHASSRRMLCDVLTCIRRKTTLEQAGFHLSPNEERYIKPPLELSRLFRKRPEAVTRAHEIAEQITFSLDHLRYEYPHESCPEGRSPADYLRELTMTGARQRYPEGVPPGVQQQIEHELLLISELQYEKYFLTVNDIVAFAVERKILCQGRGAAANSAVCYCLGITSVDPNEIRLLVERFISKERNEPPDIDIDFEHERREEVIQYIYSRFGRERAALVCEVITYRTRLALREIGKVFGLSTDTIEVLLRVVLRAEGEPITPQVLREVGIVPEDPAVRMTLELTGEIRGFPRHLSQHVGGFVITEGRLDEMVPIENAAMEDRTIMEWDKDDIDALGMLKIDILALGMLTCIRKAFDFLNGRRHPSEPEFALHTVPPEDPRVYDMLCRADSVGVFQIESRAQMSMLPRLRPRTFYDLVIEVAIVRPGPIQGGMVHPYLRRRAGKESVTFPDERVKKVLERTLGVPIFQEQAMELAVVACGFTPGEADELRRAMASWRKDKNRLKTFKKKIFDGMRRNGYSEQYAAQFFEQICGFGEYGFPQSHAASFALLVYVSSWLKCHHPAVFAAALLNSQPMGFYQPAQIVDDARRHGVSILAVDVGASEWDCTLEGTPPALRLGMRQVRGLREEEGRQIAAKREQVGPFATLETLWRKAHVRVSSLRKLAQADAFGSLGFSRQKALWRIRRFRDEELPLFQNLAIEERDPPLPEPPPLLEVVRDYQAIQLS